jgi:general secretion pathway protein F
MSATFGPSPLSPDDLTMLNEELAAMARAGLPLDQGLRHLANELGRGRLRDTTQQLADDLRAGKTLPEAMGAQDNRLPPFYASLVTAGVRSGRLPEVLATMTSYARTIADLRSSVRNAFVYPLIVLAVAIAMVICWCAFLVPLIESIIVQMRMQVPVATEAIFWISKHTLLVLVLPLGLIIGGILLTRGMMFRTEAGRRKWTRFVYRIPIVGTLIRSARLASFVELLAILVEHQVPLPEALRLAGEASSDPLMRSGIQGVEDELARGLPLGYSLSRSGLVPEFVGWMTGLGEMRGQLGPSLRHSAQIYRRQAELRARLFNSVFPSFVILGVAIVVMALLLLTAVWPMLSLIQGFMGGSSLFG